MWNMSFISDNFDSAMYIAFKINIFSETFTLLLLL